MIQIKQHIGKWYTIGDVLKWDHNPMRPRAEAVTQEAEAKTRQAEVRFFGLEADF